MPQTSIPPIEDFLREPIRLVDRPGLPEQYHQFDEDSAMAVRAALAARRPLLVRGEPGVGKTQLAAAAAKVLKRPIVSCAVDSRTESRDLLWEFDAVLRLADAQILGAFPPSRPPSFTTPDEGEPHRDQAGGHRSQRKALRATLKIRNYLRPGPLWWAFDWDGATRQARRSRSAIPHHGPDADPRNGCVVLIDEIDKAETDVPNGLLEALGSGSFTPMGQSSSQAVTITGPPPLVVITTNEERTLPNAFLRRCLVLSLALPEAQDELIKLLVARAKVHFPEEAETFGELFQEAAEKLVEGRGIAKEKFITPLPGQAEYLDLVRMVIHLDESAKHTPQTLLDSVKRFVLQKQHGDAAS